MNIVICDTAEKINTVTAIRGQNAELGVFIF